MYDICDFLKSEFCIYISHKNLPQHIVYSCKSEDALVITITIILVQFHNTQIGTVCHNVINIHKNRYTPYNIKKYKFSYHIAIKMFICIAWIDNFIQMLQTTLSS